jgi:hypothetical protein
VEQTDLVRRDARQIVFALLALAIGGWALVVLAPLSVGTLSRVGPALVPGFIAAGLVVVAGMVLASHVSGVAVAPPWLLPRGWRWAVLASLLLSLLLAVAAGLFLLLDSAPDLLAGETLLIFVGRPALVVVCLIVLTGTATGISTVPRAGVLTLLVVAFLLWELGALLLQPEIAAQVRDVPVVGSLADRLGKFVFAAGPADILAMAGLRWTLAVALGVVVMGAGLRTGIVSLLVGALAGLGGTHLASGEHRLLDLEMLRDASYAFELAVASVIILMALVRVNPLPAYIAFTSAPVVEEQFQRAMMLSRGDLLQVVAARPMASTVFLVIAVIVVALAIYRWPWRSRGSP